MLCLIRYAALVPESQLIPVYHLTLLGNKAHVPCSYSPYTNLPMCMCSSTVYLRPIIRSLAEITSIVRVQVNIPAESGEMGVLASHVPSIEQLKPGLVEVIEESGGSKQFFCTSKVIRRPPLRFTRCRLAQGCTIQTQDFLPPKEPSLIILVISVSGGFAIVQPGSQLSINAVEGFPLEDFSSDVSVDNKEEAYLRHTLNSSNRLYGPRSLKPKR